MLNKQLENLLKKTFLTKKENKLVYKLYWREVKVSNYNIFLSNGIGNWIFSWQIKSNTLLQKN